MKKLNDIYAQWKKLVSGEYVGNKMSPLFLRNIDRGKVLLEVDTLLEEVTSDANGLAAFTLDLPLGQYYVKEHKAPDGYVSSEEILTFDAGYQGQDVPVVQLSSVKKNEPTTFEFTKSDITTGKEVPGAKQPETTPTTEKPTTPDNPTNPTTPSTETPKKETPTTPKTGDDRNPLI